MTIVLLQNDCRAEYCLLSPFIFFYLPLSPSIFVKDPLSILAGDAIDFFRG